MAYLQEQDSNWAPGASPSPQPTSPAGSFDSKGDGGGSKRVLAGTTLEAAFRDRKIFGRRSHHGRGAAAVNTVAAPDAGASAEKVRGCR